MVRGGSLLRFVGQRSRSQLLKIEQKFDTFFSAQYLKYKKVSTHMPQAERNTSHELEVVDQRSRSQFLKNRTEKTCNTFNLKGGLWFFSKKILIPNVAEKNILILVEEKKKI